MVVSPYKKPQRDVVPLLLCEATARQGCVNQEGAALNHPADFLASRTVRNNFYCLLARQPGMYLLQQQECAKTDTFSEPGGGLPVFTLGVRAHSQVPQKQGH